MTPLIWTLSVAVLAAAIASLLFTILQYLNKKGSSKIKVVRKSLLWTSVLILPAYVVGLLMLPGTVEVSVGVSPEVTYADHRLNIRNKGTENLWLWGTKVGDNLPTIEREPRLITPNGFYYIRTTKLESEISKIMSPSSKGTLPIEIYLESKDHKRYVVKSLLTVHLSEERQVTIDTQTLAIQAHDWSD